MYRRNFLRGFAAGTIDLSTGSMPAAARAGLTQRPYRSCFSCIPRRTRACKIIAIGGGGCNAVSAFLSDVDQQPARITAEFICIDLGMQSLSYVQAVRQKAAPRSLPVRTISLAQYGAGGLVNAARVAALSHFELLKATVSDADAVILVAGLGGGTGSAIAPIIARLARNAGAATFAVVVTPFDFEGTRKRTSDTAIRYLELETDLEMRVSNQELADTMGDDTLMSDLSIAQEQRIATYIRAFLVTKPT
jgi:cell division protein FtsZ